MSTTQESIRETLSKCNLNFNIDVKRVNLMWMITVSDSNEPFLCAEILLDDQLMPNGKVVCMDKISDDLRVKLEKFTETLGLIILLRTKKIKTENGKMTTSGQFLNDTEFYKKILMVYDDICQKY